MQEVYKDGSLGKEREFDKDEMLKLLEERSNQIDHFRVFEKENGNKIGTEKIEEKKLEELIDKKISEKLAEQEDAKKMFRGFEMLKAEFDKKRKK